MEIMFSFDAKHSVFEIGGEVMMFQSARYLIYLQRSILNAEYIDSRPFLVGAAADVVYRQLQSVTAGLDESSKKTAAEEIYKACGYGVIDLSNLQKHGGEISAKSSFYSQSWLEDFGEAQHPVDYFTTGFLAAVFANTFDYELQDVISAQLQCMAQKDEQNSYFVGLGATNFLLYPKKTSAAYEELDVFEAPWAFREDITKTFIGASGMLNSDNDGLIFAFGMRLARCYADYIVRVQAEFVTALLKALGVYGAQLGKELMIEAGLAGGFFMFASIMSSEEWNTVVRQYLRKKEEWAYALFSVLNTMGWGYLGAAEVSKEKSIFRNYNNPEEMGCLKIKNEELKSLAPFMTQGSLAAICHLIYNSDITIGNKIDMEDGFRRIKMAKDGYQAKLTKSVLFGDKYLEAAVRNV